MYNRVIEIIREKGFIELDKFCNVDESLKIFEFRRISVNLPKEESMLKYFGIDVTNSLISTLRHEISKRVQIDIISTMSSAGDIDVIDVINSSSLEMSSKLESVFNCNKEYYKHVIVSRKISNIIQDMYRISNPIKEGKLSMYNTGYLYGINIWINPHLNHDDDRFIFFNDISMNAKITNHHIQTRLSTSSLEIEYGINILPQKVKTLFLIWSKSSKSYKDFIVVDRDKKINKILDIVL
jgi:hypothetical protein